MSVILHLLSKNTGLPHDDLLHLVRTAPRRYKSFTIPKKSGGDREIAQPARELKAIQRLLVSEILGKLPISACATAYRKGLSIKDNATPHAGGSPILKMDFKDFFPSILASDWKKYCRENQLLSDQDIEFTSLIFFRRAKNERLLRLSIGAPSSPIISNLLLKSFDDVISQEAERRDLNYTRYADDITFSGQRIGMLKDMIRVVRNTTRAIKSPKLKVNEDKTTFVTTAHRRTVTGVVLSNSGEIGLGRDRKRLISAQVHRMQRGKLSREKILELSGTLAFVNVVEPDFLQKLREKYGEGLIRDIQLFPSEVNRDA